LTEQAWRRQLRSKPRLLSGHDERRHGSDELAEGGGACGIGEQRPALEPGGELGLEIEPDAERGMAEDVVDDPELVDVPEQRMRFLARDERHRAVLA
jgi:hypothetical protein